MILFVVFYNSDQVMLMNVLQVNIRKRSLSSVKVLKITLKLILWHIIPLLRRCWKQVEMVNFTSSLDV